MGKTLWSLNKNKLYENLAQSLLDAKNEYDDGTIGWAREANYRISSPMNTAETLLGLLYSTNVISQGGLFRRIRSSIERGIKYLIKNQCYTGGWTTSESCGEESAQGNIMTTSTAIWSIVEYVILHGNEERTDVRECLDKSLEFIKSCKLSQAIYKFRPSVDKNSNMSTLYALMGLVNLSIYFNADKEKAVSDSILEMINDILSGCNVERFNSFERMFMFLTLKRLVKFNEEEHKLIICRRILGDLEITCQKLTPNEYMNDYSEERYIRENGVSSRFYYFTPIWILSAISYGVATPVDYRKHLINYIVNKYFLLDGERVYVVAQGREWTWATAQILMAFSMYGATQSIGDFLDLEEECDNNSVFVVYGRNVRFKESICQCLTAIGMDVKSFNNDGGNAQSTFEAVVKGMKESSISIVLLTGDDEGRCKRQYWLNADKNRPFEKKITCQPRMNVIFEAGYSYGYRNNQKTIIISTSEVRPFSDLDGVNKIVLELDKKGKATSKSAESFKEKLIATLINCGCTINERSAQILSGFPIDI